MLQRKIVIVKNVDSFYQFLPLPAILSDDKYQQYFKAKQAGE